VLGLAYPVVALAQSNLEVPSNGSQESGLGDVHGWKCNAVGQLTYTIDNGPPAILIYGNSRGDTFGQCGDTNNGFIAQQNWNLAGPGQHTIRVYDNGVQFAKATFTVVTLGTEYLTGQSATCNASIDGYDVTLTWQESKQNFVITGASPISYPNVAGTWQTSLDFVTEDCNFLSVPPDLPTHVGGPFIVQQNGANLTVQSGVVTFTGELESNGDFTVIADPDFNTAGTCTYALLAGFSGNFLDNKVIFLLVASYVSGNCIGVSLPCGVLYAGSITKSLALSDGQQLSLTVLWGALHQAVQRQK
jgi:hypothetical protein